MHENIPSLYPFNIHTFQKLPNAPMYITKGYVDTLMVQLSLAPFTTNGT